MHDQKYAIFTYATVRMHFFYINSAPHLLLYADDIWQDHWYFHIQCNVRFKFVYVEFERVEMHLIDLSGNTISANYIFDNNVSLMQSPNSILTNSSYFWMVNMRLLV